MGRGDPSALRWLVGSELRYFRLQANVTLAAAAKVIGCTHGKITHMENGRTQAQPAEIARLLHSYGAEQHEIDRLTTLAGESDSSTWWAPWSNVIPDWFRTYVGLEGLAASAFVYEPNLVHGLLQTENYARELTGTTVFVRPGHSDRFVSFRLARAQRLTDAEPLKLHAVIGESALRLQVGTPDLMDAEYRRLVELAELPHITLQVLRPERGPHSGVGIGPFTVLDFAQARSIAYTELIDGAIYVQGPDQVASYTMAVENLERIALSPDESVAFIKSLIATS